MEIITSRKLKGRIKKVNPLVEVYLSDIKINGDIRGCSGFIRNPETGTIVYVNTERSAYGPLSDKYMYRTAKHLKDYTGGSNRWCNCEDLIPSVNALLNEYIDGDKRISV